MTQTETSLALVAWFLFLFFAGIFSGVRMLRFWKKPAEEQKCVAGIPAWNASPAQILEFFVYAIFCLVGVPLICSQVAHAFFPEVDFQKNILLLIPVIQPVALFVLLALMKFRREAFPRPMNAVSKVRGRSWLSPFSCFGVPAFFAVGCLCVSFGSVLTILITKFLPESVRSVFEESQILVNALQADDNVFVAAACVPAIAIFTPILEELIFRAGLYRFFKSRMPSVPAAILSSVIFAILHDAPASYLPLTLLGCVLCFAYEKTGRIAAPILVHALFNANTLFCLLLASI